MEEIFIIIEDESADQKKTLSAGLDIKIAGKAFKVPFTKNCGSLDDFEVEIERIKKGLRRLLEKAEACFAGSTSSEAINVTSDMTCEQIWSVLKEIKKEGVFKESFNRLDEAKRREMAEFILTRCSVFSGNASIFSRLFDGDTARMG